MDYILTEKQIKTISEISTYTGEMKDYRDSFGVIVSELKDKIKFNKFQKLVKEYLKKELGLFDEYNKLEFEEFSSALWYDDESIVSEFFKKIFKNQDIKSNLGYFLSKTVWGLKQLGKLEVLKVPSGSYVEYVFFDPDLEISIGRISAKHLDDSDFQNKLKLPKKTYAVSLSTVDPEFKGRGYGKEMYLSVLNDVDVLTSDTGLYGDSINIWVNVLPEHHNVYAVLYKDKNFLFPIGIDKKLPKLEKVIRYIALRDPKKMLKIK